MANFVDILIDYPNSKIYIEHLYTRMTQEDLLSDKQVANYRLHIENVEKQGIEIDMEWNVWGEIDDDDGTHSNPNMDTTPKNT